MALFTLSKTFAPLKADEYKRVYDPLICVLLFRFTMLSGFFVKQAFLH